MRNDTTVATTVAGYVVGLDVGDRHSELHMIDAEGETVETATIRTTKEAMDVRFGSLPPLRVVLEVGTHSPWLSRQLEGYGHEVVVADPHRLRLIAQSRQKNDRADAETLARVGRLDLGLLQPVRHRSARAQADLAVLKGRAALVSVRTRLVNEVRGTVKALGGRLPACSAEAFGRVATPHLPQELRVAMAPLLETIGMLNEKIRGYDRTLARLAEERYPQVKLLQQVPGVGPVTALAYVLTIEEPGRFGRSREVGAYLGLVPGQRQSGERSPQLGITKAGDRLVRSLLVQCAHYVLGYRGPESDLRRWGLAKAGQGGGVQKKKVVVAVARKLAVLLHRLWVTGAVYEPVRKEESAMAA